MMNITEIQVINFDNYCSTPNQIPLFVSLLFGSISCLSILSHILIIRFIALRPPPMRPIDTVLLIDRIIQLLSESFSSIIIVISIMFKIPFSQFPFGFCTIFNYSMTMWSFQKATGGLVMALIRLSFMTNSSSLSNIKWILAWSFATQFFIQLLAFGLNTLAILMPPSLKSAFCDELSKNFLDVLKLYNGKC